MKRDDVFHQSSRHPLSPLSNVVSPVFFVNSTAKKCILFWCHPG